MMQPKTVIAKRLKDAMDERGVNAAELARMADVKKTFLYDVLSGKSLHPSSITMTKVSEILGLPLSYFTGVTTAPVTLPKQAGASPYVSIVQYQQENDADYMVFRRSWIRDHLGAKPEDLRLLLIRGDGMHPTLTEGDVVMFNTADTNPALPGLFVVNTGKAVTTKRLEHTRRNIRVLSDNAKYRAYECPHAELDILGRIVWFARAIV